MKYKPNQPSKPYNLQLPFDMPSLSDLSGRHRCNMSVKKYDSYPEHKDM